MANSLPVEPLPYTIMSTVIGKPIPWLWKPYIPRGASTMIIGDGGYGKSYMTCAIAADLSAGRALPGQAALPPQKILMISAEDGIEATFKPRLDALQANMDNIAVYDEGFTVTPKSTARVLAAVKEFDAAIVFFDPMVVYMGGDIDSFKANEVRSVLAQLNTIAKHEEIAIVGVHHVNKGGANGQHKANGSVDFANGVRSMLLVDMTKSGQYFMQHVKANWSKKGPTLAYHVSDDRFSWLGSIDDTQLSEVSHTPRGKAKAFLIAMLKDGPVSALDMIKKALEDGLSEHTIQRAKKGVCHSIEKDHKWYWELDEGIEPLPPITDAMPASGIAALADTQPSVTITGPTWDKLEAGEVSETEVEKIVREAREYMSA